jgi:hypothetical protein
MGSSLDETVANVTGYYKSSNTNEVFRIINSNVPVYSIGALSGVKAKQINSSEIVGLEYTSNDPAICRQTLELYNQVFIRKQKSYRYGRRNLL